MSLYCGCVSIIKLQTSQSKIYLTAKIPGEAEEDMGVHSPFKNDGLSSLDVYFCFWSITAGQLGHLNLSLYISSCTDMQD